jgi:hypothetical protein
LENISKLRPNIFDVEKTFSSIFRNLNAAGRIGVINPSQYAFWGFHSSNITIVDHCADIDFSDEATKN